MTETIVYGASKGEYSDYRVCAIFSTKELAKAYIAKMFKRCRYCGRDTVQDDDGTWECDTCGYQPGSYDKLLVEEFHFDPLSVVVD